MNRYCSRIRQNNPRIQWSTKVRQDGDLEFQITNCFLDLALLDDMSRREGVREESLCASEEAPLIEHQLMQQASSLHGLVSQTNAPKFAVTSATGNSNQTAAEVNPSADVNPGSNYTCTICKKQYAYKISLNKHIKSAHANWTLALTAIHSFIHSFIKSFLLGVAIWSVTMFAEWTAPLPFMRLSKCASA